MNCWWMNYESLGIHSYFHKIHLWYIYIHKRCPENHRNDNTGKSFRFHKTPFSVSVSFGIPREPFFNELGSLGTFFSLVNLGEKNIDLDSLICVKEPEISQEFAYIYIKIQPKTKRSPHAEEGIHEASLPKVVVRSFQDHFKKWSQLSNDSLYDRGQWLQCLFEWKTSNCRCQKKLIW